MWNIIPCRPSKHWCIKTKPRGKFKTRNDTGRCKRGWSWRWWWTSNIPLWPTQDHINWSYYGWNWCNQEGGMLWGKFWNVLIDVSNDTWTINFLQAYLSSQEFREKFGMNKDAFYKLPKWKQNKLKMTLQLFWVYGI